MMLALLVFVLWKHTRITRNNTKILEQKMASTMEIPLNMLTFPYCKKLTTVNAITMASLASAPPAPSDVGIGGIVEPSAKLQWNTVEGCKRV